MADDGSTSYDAVISLGENGMPRSELTGFRWSDLPFLMLAAGASFLALSAAPFWIEQGFSYSAMVGLKEADQIAARAAFACRADFAAGTVWIVLGVSAATRWPSV